MLGNILTVYILHGGQSSLMVSVFVSRSSGPGFGPDRGHLVVFLGKTLNSHGPLYAQVYKWVPANLMLGGNPGRD